VLTVRVHTDRISQMVAYYVLYITKEEDDECSDDMVVVVEMVCGGVGTL
jgi:hypothetical protein